MIFPKKALLFNSGDNAIAIPDSTFEWVPFSIYPNGDGTFNAGGFDLQAYAGISVSKTYYVATDGNDGNTGLDAEHPLAAINTAINKADADRVYVKAGWYTNDNGWKAATPNHDLEVIGYGGDVVITRDYVGLSWSSVDNHWEASCATGFSTVFDTSVVDGNGDYEILTHQDSVANVDANAGSWWYDAVADVLYVRTSDSREPDSDIHCQYSDTNGYMNDAVNYYLEGLKFYGGDRPFLLSKEGAANLYAKDCEFCYGGRGSAREGIIISGGGEVILQNCIAKWNSQDGFKAQQFGTTNANVALIDCTAYSNGESGDSNVNGFSRHNAGSQVLVNCEFYSNYGPGHADINTTKTWCLGENSHDAASAAARYGYLVGNTVEMWLDTCQSSNNADGDISVNTDATVYLRNFTPASPTIIGDGTVTTY